jgi:hypothetical protein
MDLIGESGEKNGMEELQLRLDEEGLRGLFVDHLPFWAIRCSIGWDGSGLRWLRWPVTYEGDL